MPAGPALLAQLQTLWQAAAPPPPAAHPPPGFFAANSDTEPPRGTAKACTELPAFAHQKKRAVTPPDNDQAAGVCLWPGEPTAADLGPFAMLDDAEREYLLGRHRYAEPCGFCGGRFRHNPQCVALCDEWQILMPFGKHKGKPVVSLDRDYLAWLLKSGMELNAELRREIERVLGIEQDA